MRKKNPSLSRKLCTAPMMDWTDTHCRFFFRQLSPSSLLYTEMIHAKAVINGDREQLLRFNPEESPVALQLGGSDPKELALAARIGEDWGYSEINLNCGCPSERVVSGCFGAALMDDPYLVSDCMSAMINTVSIPVTIKHRLGLNYESTYSFVRDFVKVVGYSGCSTFIVHARNAVLNGLSPKQNRTVPKLNYNFVYKLQKEFPHLCFIVNGEIDSLAKANLQVSKLPGVMIGRAAYKNPYLLAQIDDVWFGTRARDRFDIAEAMNQYLQTKVPQNINPRRVTKSMLGLFKNEPGAKLWRQLLSDSQSIQAFGREIISHALSKIQSSSLPPLKISNYS